MARDWISLLVLLATPAGAVELPDSARQLVPMAWSVSVSAPELEASPDADWVLAVGGRDLVELVRLSSRVAAVASADSLVTQASGRSLQTASGLLPRLGGSASWQTGTPTAAFSALGGDGDSMDQYSASADLTAPLSLWSSIPDQRAARADRLSAESNAIDARATATIDLASAFLDLAQAEESLVVVERQLRVEQDLLTVAEARYGAGAVTGVDVLQQRQQLASTQADLPAAEADVGRARRALAALLRLPPDQLPDVLPTALPEPVLLPLPDPSDLSAQERGVRDRAVAGGRTAPTSVQRAGKRAHPYSVSTAVRP